MATKSKSDTKRREVLKKVRVPKSLAEKDWILTDKALEKFLKENKLTSCIVIVTDKDSCETRAFGETEKHLKEYVRALNLTKTKVEFLASFF